MNNSKISKALKVLVVPELILAIYVMLFWVFPFVLQTAISVSGI